MKLRAVWPPLSLIALDIALLGAVFWLGWWPLAVPLLAGLAILVFDTAGRARDHASAVAFLSQGGDPRLIAKSCQFSWCGRVACQAAADSVGARAGGAVRRFYAVRGYRWFHIFPDETFTLRSPFLSGRFWRITLFGNHYASAMVGETAGRRAASRRMRRAETRREQQREAA